MELRNLNLFRYWGFSWIYWIIKVLFFETNCQTVTREYSCLHYKQCLTLSIFYLELVNHWWLIIIIYIFVMNSLICGRWTPSLCADLTVVVNRWIQIQHFWLEKVESWQQVFSWMCIQDPNCLPMSEHGIVPLQVMTQRSLFLPPMFVSDQKDHCDRAITVRVDGLCWTSCFVVRGI